MAIEAVHRLSDREIEVLRHVVEGKSTRAIAVELTIAADTVKNHLTHSFKKLNAKNRTQAAIKAVILGIIELPDLEITVSRGKLKEPMALKAT